VTVAMTGSRPGGAREGTTDRTADRPDSSFRLLAMAAGDLAEHHRRAGPLPWQGGPGRLIPLAERSGLRGRGGAGFPAWRKLTAVASGARPVVVGNAAEGEPASGKDATLLIRCPHLVLDGLQLAAEAVGAEQVCLYLPAGPAEAAARRALAERERSGWDRFAVRVHQAPEGFVSGEESAVIASLEGRPALPRFKRRLAVEAGVGRRPTLVQNVETLAHLAMLARGGERWFRQVGTAAEPGTFLATISGAVRAPGVVEAPYGVRLRDLLAAAGGPSEELGAVLVGGYHGAWLPASGGLDAAVSREGLAPWGASPGAGVVIALPARACGLEFTARVASYLAGQSARQCGPCLNGLPAMADVLTRLAQRRGDAGLVPASHRLIELVSGRGACHHPDGTARMVSSALRVFETDVRAHLSGTCLAAATAATPAGKGGVT
jgi:NADH:ubiquinone oxidoreductase subunit F (NADH-binding)